MRSQGHLQLLAISRGPGLPSSPHSSGFPVVPSLTLSQCFAPSCCEAGLSSSSPVGSTFGLGVWYFLVASLKNYYDWILIISVENCGLSVALVRGLQHSLLPHKPKQIDIYPSYSLWAAGTSGESPGWSLKTARPELPWRPQGDDQADQSAANAGEGNLQIHATIGRGFQGQRSLQHLPLSLSLSLSLSLCLSVSLSLSIVISLRKAHRNHVGHLLTEIT